MNTPKYIKASCIYLPRELDSFKRKKGNYLQPIFEAVTNAWEAIMDKFGNDNLNRGSIVIKLFAEKGLDFGNQSAYNIQKITIEDNGIGLDEANLERLKNLRDPSKGHSNNGTGRIQYLFFFGSTNIESVSAAGKSKSKMVKVTLSMNSSFLVNNSIMRLDEEHDVEFQPSRTVVTFNNPLDEKESQSYGALSAGVLKSDIVHHSLARLCDNREKLPKITIERYLNNELEDTQEIKVSDIPVPDKDEDVEVPYVAIRENKVVKTDKKESFRIRSFVVSESKMEGNRLYLVSKGELGNTLPLDLLADKETVDGNRYMFLLSGEYLDARDSDDRGNINLMKESELKKSISSEYKIFQDEEFVLKEHIVEEVNGKISTLYQVFEEKEREKDDKIQELQEMFLLDPNTVNAIRSKVRKQSTDADILKLVYEGEMEKIANMDASIKKAVKDVEALDPTEHDYQDKLQQLVKDFASMLPEQNRNALSKYIARRKLVLELFEKIMNNNTDSLRGGKRIDENVLHNLIFRQHSIDPQGSDLWLLEDQYLYFEGCSEKELNQIKINGTSLLKKKLTDEEKAYKLRQEKDVGDRRPDVLLYPAEGKCIIVEFKAPDVDVSEHLSQINRYAMIIHNLSDASFQFNTFYGYLIGENIDYDSIQESNSDFKQAVNLKYIFRPNYIVPGRFGHKDADLYTEIIKYSDLLKRAQDRNKVFIDKLEGK
jgi:hypothetical protein